MSNDDDEILQDFLVEAGEILEQSSEQLVDLERTPEDSDLLNAIFRGFHTVKGGAGFLQFEPMVDCCHVAENAFDVLRKGEISLTPELMDTVLSALDSVNTMFDEIRNGDELTPAEPELIDALTRVTEGGVPEPAEEPEPETVEVSAPVEADDATPEAEGSASDSDIITDDEFEDLLDALQGKQGEANANEKDQAGSTDESKPEPESSDEISEEEFEALLDQRDADKKAPEVNEEKKKPAEVPTVTDEVKVEKETTKTEPAPGADASAKPAVAEKPPKPAKSPPKESAGEATVRVDTRRLDEIMNMVGELVLVRNRLVRLGANSQDEDMNKAVSNLDVVTADLQSSVMKTRMQPIKKVFGRFPRVVRDLARNLKKEINLELIGEETDLDKNLVEALADPLVHLVRNSVDHGIENPDDREAVGKPLRSRRNRKAIIFC